MSDPRQEDNNPEERALTETVLEAQNKKSSYSRKLDELEDVLLNL